MLHDSMNAAQHTVRPPHVSPVGERMVSATWTTTIPRLEVHDPAYAAAVVTRYGRPDWPVPVNHDREHGTNHPGHDPDDNARPAA